MRISELLQKESIALGRKPQDKADAIGQMVELLAKSGSLEDKKKFKQAILERERLSTTGIGEGIAIPHGKSSAVKRAALAAMVVPQGVDFASADGAPVHLLFMIAVPEEGAELHLEVLERLAAMLMDEDFRKRLTAAKDAAEFLRILSAEEEKRFAETAEKQEYDYDVLAVTACPTGIAHTFMAAESLENKAREMGITIKVETNGSGGAKNVLTAKEIRAAKGIIVAADKNVEMQRFYGKRVLQVPESCQFRLQPAAGCFFQGNRGCGVWLYATDSGRLYRDGDCRPTCACTRLCGRLSGEGGRQWLFGGAPGRLCGRVSDSAAEEAL